MKSRGKSKLTPTVNECSPSIGPLSRDTETSEPLTGQLFPQWTCSAEDSPAKTFQTSIREGKGLVAKSLDCGVNTKKLSTAYGLNGFSLKIPHPSAVRGFGQCSTTLTRSGLTRNGIVFRLVPLVPLTSGIGRGLWLTPTASDTKPACKREILEPATRNGKQWNLRGQATEISQLGTPLNPIFLEWLMGYPTGWTEIGPSATPLSRK